MREFLNSIEAQAVIWVSVLLIVAAFGTYVVLFFRNRNTKSEVSASELLSRFRDMQEQGDISPAEFHEIKSVLGPRLRDAIRSKDADGEV